MGPSLTVFFYWYEVRVYLLQFLLLTHSCNMMHSCGAQTYALVVNSGTATLMLAQQIPNTCKPLPWFHSKLLLLGGSRTVVASPPVHSPQHIVHF
jgi:hypothetical protein